MDRALLRRSYDRSARTYDQVFTAQQRPKIEALAAALPAHALGPVLDAGAGTGLLRRIIGGDPVQLDLSGQMLAHASGRRVVADMARLPFPDNAFGTVWSVTSLIDFVDPGPCLSELARVLRPGGFLALSVLKIEHIAGLEAYLPRVGAPPEHAPVRLDLSEDFGYIIERGTPS